MKVAWVTHHIPRSDDASWLLPGGLGGAEMTDAAMMEQAPTSVEIAVITPDKWEEAIDADRVIITGTDLLSDEAMLRLADCSPIVWIHHAQTPSKARQELFARAKPFVTMSRQHSQVEAAWSGVASEWCHGHIDLGEIKPAEKTKDALWAARNHPQKGLLAARRWARANDLELTELSGVERSQVLQEMAVHDYFVFLPQGFDSCPRTLIEAEAAGCWIQTNHQAGRIDDGPIEEVMAAQAPKFWSWL